MRMSILASFTFLCLRFVAFRWNAPDPVIYATRPYAGTAHTSDIYFLFDGKHLDPLPSAILIIGCSRHQVRPLYVDEKELIESDPPICSPTGNAGNTFTPFNSVGFFLPFTALPRISLVIRPSRVNQP